MSVSVNLPRRGRRSSISEHIQRVFHVDRPDKKCEGLQSNSGSPVQPSATQPKAGFHHTRSDAAINYAAPTRSSFTYSSQASGQPVSSTPHSSPSLRPLSVEDGKDSSQQMRSVQANRTDAERDEICSSPTWRKDIARKERRATKRLEADRKDLEERLLRLEANQARLEQGIYERTPRRLTKKQPLGSSNRVSSANSWGRRSSSTFSSLFSGSRRSRSRASSVTGNDGASSRGSTDNPPTLSLTLPERFGTAISRELAAQHGTFLLSSPQPQRTLHTTPKSDDLGENWKVAEAWQRKYCDQEAGAEMAGQKSEFAMISQPLAHNVTREDELRTCFQTEEPSTELPTELNRELFTTNLRHDRRTLGSRPTASSSIPRASERFDPDPPISTNVNRIAMDQLSLDAKRARVATARQLRSLSRSGNMPNLSRLSPSNQSPSVESGQREQNTRKEQRDPIRRPLHTTARSAGSAENRRPQAPINSQEQRPGQTLNFTHQTHRLKHAARSVSQPINRPARLMDEGLRLPNPKTCTPVGSNQDPVVLSALPSEETPRDKSNLRCLDPPARSRSSSQTSSDASYDTADEEVLSVSHCDNAQTTNQHPCVAASPRPPQDTRTVNKQGTGRVGTQNNSLLLLARGNSLTRFRRKPKNQTKPLTPVQLVAKVFVICCRCNYWHDMPSEVYARLACPERLPNESLLARTFSRRNTSSRKSPLRNSQLASDPTGKRQPPMQARAQFNVDDTQAARESKAAVGTPLTPPSCCWCKHNMTRSCCQGWTTLVQMRERHH